MVEVDRILASGLQKEQIEIYVLVPDETTVDKMVLN